MNCKTAEIYLDAMIDNELSVSDGLEVIEHIETCSQCKSKWELSEEIKSKLKHYINLLKPPANLKTKIYKKLQPSATIAYPQKVLLAASISFLIGLGLLFSFYFAKQPTLMDLHNKTKLQLVTNNVDVVSSKLKINLNKHKLAKFENAQFQIEGASQIVKPFSRDINLVALKNDKGQKVSICFLSGDYKMEGCHKMEMNGITFFCGKSKDCHFAYWEQGEKTIALVGDGITSGEMIQLAMPLIQEV